jgi:hypothetical protein
MLVLKLWGGLNNSFFKDNSHSEGSELEMESETGIALVVFGLVLLALGITYIYWRQDQTKYFLPFSKYAIRQ